ncbi:MAG: hypothetical protein RR657_05100 [Peptostreptococcaceae bacterium]
MSIFNEKEEQYLTQLGVDIIPEERNYWFIRTQGGEYYNDFVNEGFVGIEWDEISNINLINSKSENDLKIEAIKYYPKYEKPGYIVNSILRFAHDIKKGDVVLIPSVSSKWFSIGEILEDEMFIYDEDEDESDNNRFVELLDSMQEDNNDIKKQIIKKRRKVKWIKQVKREELDPYLYGIIYSHGAISPANKYATYIDRALSHFYIKGEEAYFTYQVNKKQNIPYSDMFEFLSANNDIIKFINKYIQNDELILNDLILKINVQSKGPLQLKGTVYKVLVYGLVITGLFGADMSFKAFDCEMSISTKGLPALLTEVNTLLNKEDINKVKNELNKSKEKLEISLPEVKIVDEHAKQSRSAEAEVKKIN